MGTVAMGCPTAGSIAVGGWVVGTIGVGSPTAVYVAVDGWAVGTVAVVSPTVFFVAVGGWAVGAVTVVSPTVFFVAVGGCAVGTVGVVCPTVFREIASFDPPVPPCSDAEQSCRASNMLAPIRANQGKDGFCTSGGSGCRSSGVATCSSSV